MKKFLVITIPILALLFFVLIMLSGDVLKQPFWGDDNLPLVIETLVQDVTYDKWEKADQNAENLEIAWAKIVTRVQYSSERDEINALSMNIARIKGAIQAKDKSIVLTELSEAYQHWRELGK